MSNNFSYMNALKKNRGKYRKGIVCFILIVLVAVLLQMNVHAAEKRVSTNSKFMNKTSKELIYAFNSLGFKVVINRKVSYSGMFTSRDRKIVLKKKDNTIYHEFGHFLAFVAGNMDQTAYFKKIYKEERKYYKYHDKNMIRKSSSEYFAESYRNYVLSPKELKKTRPRTYAAIRKALKKITPGKIKKMKRVYGVIWEANRRK